MVQYICLAEGEHDEGIEIPVDEDGNILLSTVDAQFHGASGIKYRADTGKFRAVPLVEGHLQPPISEYGDTKYIVVFPKGIGKYLFIYVSMLIFYKNYIWVYL